MLIIIIIAILLSTFNRCIQFEVHVRDTSWMFVYLCDHRLPYCTGLNAVNFFALIYIVKHLHRYFVILKQIIAIQMILVSFLFEINFNCLYVLSALIIMSE